MTLRDDHWLALAAFVLFLGISSCLGGCGGAPKAARTAIDVTAHELVLVDQAAAVRYAAAADAALDASTTLDQYRRSMARWDRVEAAIRSTRASLIVAERAVDAWDESEDGARAALGCLADALQLLTDALAGAGVPVPQKLLEVASLGASILGPCEVSP